MKSSKMTQITCPYCNLIQNVLITIATPEYFVIHCNVEDGGCERPIALSADWKPVVKVFEMAEVAK